MPLYDYKCANCGKTCEVLVSTHKEGLTVWCAEDGCLYPNGDGHLMVRQPSAPSFVIKGASYRNGYSGKGE